MRNAVYPLDCSSQPPQIRSATSAASPLDLLRAQGYVIFERLVPESLIARINDELEPWFAATPRCRGDFYGWNTTRFGALLLKSAASQALLLNDLMLSIMDAVLGPHCDWYQLNLSQAVRIHSGERQQVPHRDEEMWPGAKNGHEYLVNVMWALSDFTADNGATMLWPRSQFSSLTRQMNPSEAVVAQMPRGSALVYLGSVTHCGGENRSAQPRTGLIFSYCLGWLKQYENAFLTYPPHVAAQFPKAIRDLLGYRIHRPNLGGYEGQDPAVLFETNSHVLAAVDSVSEATAQELQAHYAVEAAARTTGQPGRGVDRSAEG
jgi:ectoine hydroxylase-related dioxygenase (phytanoyl-CoA dioxygenase family)